MGYHRAGFEVLGVDIKPQPNYPFGFIRMDVIELFDSYSWILDGFDVIAASPPCQAYSRLRALHPTKEYPDLVAPVRERLILTGKPYVVENVEGAPLINPVTMCGSMFRLGVDEFALRRHRLFESNFHLEPYAPCDHSKIAIGVFGHGSNQSRKNSKGEWRGRQASKREAVAAMGIDWMTGSELSQAIPPAYTECIGEQLLHQLELSA